MTAGTAPLTTVASTIYSGSCTTLRVKNPKDNTINVLVNVPGLHDAGEYDVLEPGDEGIYRVGFHGIKSATAKSASGTPSCLVGARSYTNNSDQ
jgi:hypothetical protein